MQHPDVFAFLSQRRSARPAMLSGPGPSAEQIRKILTIASRVPDHKKLAPWRFLTFAGTARADFGDVLVDALSEEQPEACTAGRLLTERERLTRAPLVIAAILSPKRTDVVPAQEQTLSAGAACLNLCLAANAMGFATAWLTEWYSYSPRVASALGLADHECVAGFIYVGSSAEPQADRDRPELDTIVSAWSRPATRMD